MPYSKVLLPGRRLSFQEGGSSSRHPFSSVRFAERSLPGLCLSHPSHIPVMSCGGASGREADWRARSRWLLPRLFPQRRFGRGDSRRRSFRPLATCLGGRGGRRFSSSLKRVTPHFRQPQRRPPPLYFRVSFSVRKNRSQVHNEN